ncbi:hypothetical protein C2S53_003115 [Perilla frutescens var. hirtella]|uniref:Uncharacterized protein n=1 Tax=Perilla frutescens var. hirtella TaxID=608512 RepID=A0AAD4JNZ3_PERFH|nr:hypothetical protein C2S53_003115 [Perilla frutescens var. hirtella]
MSSNLALITPKSEPLDEPPLSLHLSAAFSATPLSVSEIPGIAVNQRDSDVIVPLPLPETQASDFFTPPWRSWKYPARPSEMFASLLLSIGANRENTSAPCGHRTKRRCDSEALFLMKQRGLCVNHDKKVVGDIPGISVGDVFLYRSEMTVIGLHGQRLAGIDYVPAAQCFNGQPIATSVVVSGDKNHKQAADQKLKSGNLAMMTSMKYGIEVRVIRGLKYGGSASGKLYVYDGLYRIKETLFDVGKSGFRVYKFKLARIENQPEMGSVLINFAERLKTRPLEVRPKGHVFSIDLSKSKENLPVFFYNDIDSCDDPLRYDYLVKTIFPPNVYISAPSSGCQCVDGCRDGCFCSKKNGGVFPYDSKGFLPRGKPLIFECGPHRRCPPTCRNRFEVFRSRETLWGVRTLDLIHAGSFICVYTGVVLTYRQAPICRMNDVLVMRNVASYICHSSSPNVFVQHVLYDHNDAYFPHLMLFARENIPPMTQLSLDYGISDGRI